MCLTRQRDFPGDPSAIAAARDFVAALVVAMLDPGGWGVADDAALLASELVTGAVEAGCSHLELLAALHADRLELSVTGYGGGAAAASGSPDSSLRERLLAGVAESARFTRRPDGTTVGSARLSCEPRWTAAVPCALGGGRSANGLR